MKRVVFLDRDGTLNVDHGYVYRIEDWQWQLQAIAALKDLQSKGFVLAVVTNQSGIGHGLYTKKQMQALHAYMEKELAAAGVQLEAIAYCPHRRDGGCDCRKPKLGMIRDIEKKLGAIDYPASWMIGDKLVDVRLGQMIGTHTALVRSRYWTDFEDILPPDIVVDSLAEAAAVITNTP